MRTATENGQTLTMGYDNLHRLTAVAGPLGTVKAVIRGELAFDMKGVGPFSLQPVGASWIDLLMLGARDIYSGEAVAGLQIVPSDEG